MNQLQTRPQTDLATHQEQIGQSANYAAQRHVFADYQERRARNTLARQRRQLELFATFLESISGAPYGDLFSDPAAWESVTWGLVKAFVVSMARDGYAVGSLNCTLSTLKVFAGLAFQSGTLGQTEYALIRAVKGYYKKERVSLDEKRADEGLATRRGDKKAVAVVLTANQVADLKDQPNTAQGRRDRLLITLMADYGLRVGEVVALVVTDFDLVAGTLTFYREKVDKHQTIQLASDALEATRRYFASDAPPLGKVFLGSRRGARLTGKAMTRFSVTKRVRDLGQRIGIDGLSAHDLRHTWATRAARAGTPIKALQNAGGWSSPSMPLHYIENNAIANAGVKLE